jgi:hypothetical protein
MPIESYKMGPGSFTIGSTPFDVSCQVTSLTVNPTENVTTEAAVHTLCGDTLPASDTVDYSFTVSGSVLQDLAAAGVVDYTWTNMGDEVPFVFVPNTVEDRSVTGTCRLVPLTIGGDVSTRPTSDFEWAIIGTPVFGAAA